MDTTEAPPSTGLVGGKYELVKLIGRGGMGSVWEARHVSLGTPSAIKFIEAEYANSAEARSRFDKEAKAAATIQSKHAIQVYDHGVTDDGKPYIVMELLTGEPLDKRIERLGALSLQETARILQHVARGLARAHERGIVHRDLKPENIFIVRNTDDDEEIAKVLDFGIAKIQSNAHSPGVSSSTKTGAVLGTPFYMSPEQARGLRNVDHRTDVWSLGVIAFKCVAGRLPFDGESVGDLLVKICTAPVPLPSQFVPGLPPAFDTWFLRALEREPERRFANVTELSEHLAFAAGIGTRGPISSQNSSGPGFAPVPATIAASSGGMTPAQAQRASFPDRGGVDPSASHGAQTPHPAGMTAAPFTSSQPVPGASGSRGKWLVGAALIGLLLAGAATALALKVRGGTGAVAGNSVGVTQSPPRDTASAAAVTAPEDPIAHAALPIEPAQPAGDTPVAVAHAAPTGQSLRPAAGGKRPGSGVKPPTGAAPSPPLPPASSPPAVVAPPTPTPVPTPTGKKPNKNDPGY